MASKKAEGADTPAVTLASLGLENYDVVEIHPSELKNATYNPRTLPDEAKKKLRAQLKKNGLVGTPTWNERTGNIVGGHQRIAALDALAGTANYTIKVARIDVDDKKEKELNIALNNDEAMGIWDLGKLDELLRDPSLDMESTGFNAADVMSIFGDTMVAKADDTRFDDLALKLDAMRETFKKIDAKRDEDATEFYFVAIFRSGEECEKFLKDHGLPKDRYQSGDTLRVLIAGGRGPLPQLQKEVPKGAAVPGTAPAQ